MSDSSSSENSDAELQNDLQAGAIQPGLYQKLPAPKKILNKKADLLRRRKKLLHKLDWIERVDVVVDTETIESNLKDADDDFNRELIFLRQAQKASELGLARLHKLKVVTKRPDDYFAEMAKSDEHMEKVRQRLVEQNERLQRSEKVKQLRQAKKYAKQVQREVSRQRQEEKKKVQGAMKKLIKGKSDRSTMAEVESFLDIDTSQLKSKKAQKAQPKTKSKPNRKREYKNSKFGYGGQKKRSKYNTADSASNFASDFSRKKHSAAPHTIRRKFQNKNRPGKARRQKLNNTSRKRKTQ